MLKSARVKQKTKAQTKYSLTSAEMSHCEAMKLKLEVTIRKKFI